MSNELASEASAQPEEVVATETPEIFPESKSLGPWRAQWEVDAVAWPQVVQQIGWDLVEESREQYLRYAVEVTRQFQLAPGRTPERSLAALDIISLLTK